MNGRASVFLVATVVVLLANNRHPTVDASPWGLNLYRKLCLVPCRTSCSYYSYGCTLPNCESCLRTCESICIGGGDDGEPFSDVYRLGDFSFLKNLFGERQTGFMGWLLPTYGNGAYNPQPYGKVSFPQLSQTPWSSIFPTFGASYSQQPFGSQFAQETAYPPQSPNLWSWLSTYYGVKPLNQKAPYESQSAQESSNLQQIPNLWSWLLPNFGKTPYSQQPTNEGQNAHESSYRQQEPNLWSWLFPNFGKTPFNQQPSNEGQNAQESYRQQSPNMWSWLYTNYGKTSYTHQPSVEGQNAQESPYSQQSPNLWSWLYPNYGKTSYIQLQSSEGQKAQESPYSQQSPNLWSWLYPNYGKTSYSQLQSSKGQNAQESPYSQQSPNLWSWLYTNCGKTSYSQQPQNEGQNAQETSYPQQTFNLWSCLYPNCGKTSYSQQPQNEGQIAQESSYSQQSPNLWNWLYPNYGKTSYSQQPQNEGQNAQETSYSQQSPNLWSWLFPTWPTYSEQNYQDYQGGNTGYQYSQQSYEDNNFQKVSNGNYARRDYNGNYNPQGDGQNYAQMGYDRSQPSARSFYDKDLNENSWDAAVSTKYQYVKYADEGNKNPSSESWYSQQQSPEAHQQSKVSVWQYYQQTTDQAKSNDYQGRSFVPGSSNDGFGSGEAHDYNEQSGYRPASGESSWPTWHGYWSDSTAENDLQPLYSGVKEALTFLANASIWKSLKETFDKHSSTLSAALPQVGQAVSTYVGVLIEASYPVVDTLADVVTNATVNIAFAIQEINNELASNSSSIEANLTASHSDGEEVITIEEVARNVIEGNGNQTAGPEGVSSSSNTTTPAGEQSTDQKAPANGDDLPAEGR